MKVHSSPSSRRLFLIALACLVPSFSLVIAQYADFSRQVLVSEEGSEPRAESPMMGVAKPKQGVLTTTLWYLPNRVMDLVDIFRLRLKVGPGLGVGVRMTDYAAFYGGSQYSIFLGLPGPRYPEALRYPVGLEYQRGLVLAGVDASDDLKYPPRYGFSEVDAGLHLILIGAEAGIDPFEIADFLAGLFLIDLRRDDYPRAPAPPLPERGSVVVNQLIHPDDTTDPKPDTFANYAARLDYLERNVPLRLQGDMQYVDQRFAAEGQPLEVQPPMHDLSFGIYIRSIVGGETDVEFKPDVSLDVALPNLERRLSLFVESSSSDDLPGRDSLEQEDNGFTIGARKRAEDWNISVDAGVRAKWLPELYSRVAWQPSWEWDAWRFRLEERAFWESDDGFGTLTSLAVHRWFANNRWLFKENTSGKISESTDGYEWEQSLAVGRVFKLFDENRRANRRSIGSDDAISGYALKGSIFGQDEEVTQYRILGTYRFALYKDFVVGDFRTGPQWRESEDWDPELRIDLGVSLIF